jgi:hypothetical protein
MKRIVLIGTVLLFAVASTNAQRGEGGDDNPYAKIYIETNAGKRTARCLKSLFLPDVFNGSFNTSPCNDFAERGDTRIKQFEEFISFFSSSEKDDKQMQAAGKKYSAETFKHEYEDINYRIGYADKQGTFTSDNITPIENLVCRVKGSLQSIKAIKAYLTGVKKIFPSAATKADEVIKFADEALAKYTDNKAIIASIKSNLGAELAEVYFPKPVTQNAEWEGWFKSFFAKSYSGYTILKQSLLTKDWYIKKNEISGLPEYRQMGAAIGAKAANGKCYIIKIDIFQDYIGGKFSASRFDEYDKKEILCENLK